MRKEKFSVDVDEVLKGVLKKKNSHKIKSANRIELTDEVKNSGVIKKLAFDVYRVENDPYKDLWMLEKDGDKQFLVRTSEPTYASKENGSWSAISDYGKENVTLSYKGIPISRFSSSTYGFTSDDVFSFKEALLDLANKDHTFLREVFSEQPANKRAALAQTFPELKEFIDS